ncbi:hypothetical protein OG625_01630 [Streptomyces sp. NBC_01351]|uniref:hypothetical protein n=1 Tax=Streptomyces sp. NBC_01351 TaxID=2903833 RepID=UPI002E367CBF|nr:hypothetical protein [Streptomyces sp. NBC_01351]
MSNPYEIPYESATPARRKRVWPLTAVLVVSAAALAALGLKLTGSSSDGEAGSGAPATSASASPSPASPKKAAPAGGAADRPMIPLADAFPAQVKDATGATFTRVGSVALASCTEPDSVGPTLAALIEGSAGCVGEQVALYKDAQNNQFNLAVFTMKDPQDTMMLVSRLAMAFDDYQVGAQAPPPGSGLRTLPPDSGMVQAFTGQGRAMVVGLGQWSDGRVADYQQLVDRLDPLLQAVSKNVGDHETKN